jgi:hypothetical protein
MSALLAFSVVSALSAGQIWHHEGQPAQIVELFTSEGCSSCPPADKYLSKLKNNNELWTSLIPIAYHVDYWNYLGWEDKFAKPEFAQLQRLYHAYGLTSSVYTPGFIVDGKEWRGFFNWVNRELPTNTQIESSRLTLVRKGTQFELSYPSPSSLDATIVFLANNKKSVIKAGENRGKTLNHDFIVRERLTGRSKEGKWIFELGTDLEQIDAVAAWVSKAGQFERIQTVAGEIQ